MNQNEQEYIHVDNGGIEVSVGETEYGDYSVSFTTSYCGYPHVITTLNALTFEQLEHISKFLSKRVATIKLKR